VWGEFRLDGLEPGVYENLLTGVRHELGSSAPLAEIFAEFPLALLLAETP
jgi:hypothetical protein